MNTIIQAYGIFPLLPMIVTAGAAKKDSFIRSSKKVGIEMMLENDNEQDNISAIETAEIMSLIDKTIKKDAVEGDSTLHLNFNNWNKLSNYNEAQVAYGGMVVALTHMLFPRYYGSPASSTSLTISPKATIRLIQKTKFMAQKSLQKIIKCSATLPFILAYPHLNRMFNMDSKYESAKDKTAIKSIQLKELLKKLVDNYKKATIKSYPDRSNK